MSSGQKGFPSGGSTAWIGITPLFESGKMTNHDFTQYLLEEIPDKKSKNYNSIFDEEKLFSIEISIPMRKPKDHFSRAPGIVLEILKEFDGGTFFKAQGYWKGVQEPVIYVLISKNQTPRWVIDKLKQHLKKLQRKLKQKEVFVKINGSLFCDSFPEFKTEEYPEQWDFDTDMGEIIANQAAKDEHYQLCFARAKEEGNQPIAAYRLYQEIFSDLMNPGTEIERRDLLITSSNLLGIITDENNKVELEKQELIKKDKFEEILTPLVLYVNKHLPFSSKSKFPSNILSPHAEARIRGSRIMLNRRLENSGSLQNAVVPITDLISDGIFALKQISGYLGKKGTPYLDYDPIKDLHQIRRQINTLTSLEPQEVKDIISSLCEAFPLYKDEINSSN